MMNYLWLLCSTVTVLFATDDTKINSPIVQTTYGPIQGYVYTSAVSEQSTNVYLGIPFAKPPVGDLRFEKPERPDSWEELKVTTNFGPMCLQSMPLPAEMSFLESEDCLHLNVLAPSLEKPGNDLYPVMVWIHGGGFTMGSSMQYGADGLCDYMVSKGVVVVSINYRLGLLGFLSVENAAAGNWGLHDQVAALKWVSENIEAFGGDPNKVTIYGESAGGAAVSLLTVIPEAQPHFTYSIAQSGSALASFGISRTTDIASRITMRRNGCTVECDKCNVKCMKATAASTLRELAIIKPDDPDNEKPISPEYLAALMFGPVVDGDLIPKEPAELIKEGALKPGIIGVNSNEMGFFLAPIPRLRPFLESNGIKVMDVQDYNVSFFDSFVKRAFVDLSEDEAEKAIADVRNFYLGQNPTQQTIFERFTDLQSDLLFNLPAAREIHERTKVGAKTYVYQFDHYSPNVFPEVFPYKGAHHAFDITYLFNHGCGYFDFEWTPSDRKVQEHMTTLWTNFAKYGTPTVDGSQVTWPPIDNSGNDVNNLIIAEKPTLSTDFYGKNLQMWNNVQGNEGFVHSEL